MELQQQEQERLQQHKEKEGKQYTAAEISRMADEALNSTNQASVKKVMFAGKEFIIDKNGNIQAADSNPEANPPTENPTDPAEDDQSRNGAETNLEVRPGLSKGEMQQRFKYIRDLMEKI